MITGGSRGIGEAVALGLAAQGWDLAISYRERADEAEEVVKQCRAKGVRAIAIQADVANDDEVVAMFKKVDAELGTIGALINNAGIVGMKERVDEYTPERVQRIFAVNVFGAFACAREAVRRMSTLHGGVGGVIVNVSSAASRLGSPGEYVDYASSKAAMDTMTLGLAKEVAAEGIRVNAVRPGIVVTEIHASGGQPDRAERVAPNIPMLRPGQPEEIASAVLWLCQDDNTFTTGAMIDVSGGR